LQGRRERAGHKAKGGRRRRMGNGINAQRPLPFPKTNDLGTLQPWETPHVPPLKTLVVLFYALPLFQGGEER